MPKPETAAQGNHDQGNCQEGPWIRNCADNAGNERTATSCDDGLHRLILEQGHVIRLGVFNSSRFHFTRSDKAVEEVAVIAGDKRSLIDAIDDRSRSFRICFALAEIIPLAYGP